MQGLTLMVQGTMSSVGKSLMVAALCRIFRQDGLSVAPFKAQNMALNSFATLDGREVGRAQAMQAEAAGIAVTVEMNPVLIKPEADTSAQIVVLGKTWTRLSARDYIEQRHELWRVVTEALDTLRRDYDIVVIEGAGSPVELNLKQGDVVNMAIAKYAGSPVLLLGDIDRGGIFAQLLGTLALLEPEERALVAGLIVNKFRGDMSLFADGVEILSERSNLPVLGVVPFIPDLRIADEDSVALDDRAAEARGRSTAELDMLDIAVIRLPHISNFDDFDPLMAEDGVRVRFVGRAPDLGHPDLIILPGTKTTVADLQFLREQGLDERIVQQARTGVPVLGICGGLQMLGLSIRDPLHAEADKDEVTGLGLLPVITHFEEAKETVQAHGNILPDRGLFANARHLPAMGYEIHMGRSIQPIQQEHDTTCAEPDSTALVSVKQRGGQDVDKLDGMVSEDGWVAGTYFHGLFDNDALRHRVLANLAARKGVTRAATGYRFDRAAIYDRLAGIVRAHLDVAAIYRLLDRGVER
jgi:adenosylcobyric acid synthase